MTANIERPASPTVRLTAWLLISMLLATVVGSYLAKIEVVARGQGKVIPLGRVQVVQPMADGKIAAILVSEGQFVNVGDTLLKLDRTSAEGDVKRIEATIGQQVQSAYVAKSIVTFLSNTDFSNSLSVDIGRTAFQRSANNIAPPTPDAEALVVSTLSALSDQVLQFDAQIERCRKSHGAQTARLEKLQSDKELVATTVAAAGTLRRQGSISEFDYRNRLRELKAIEGETIVAERQLDELAAEAAVLYRQRASLISTTASTYRKQMNEAEIALQGLRAEIQAAKSQLENLTLRAPTSGRVEQLSVFTVGGFVEAGTTVMSVVPSGQDIEVEAFFDNRDIGFLESGQKAFMKFDAFPAERFGIVRGRVADIGADARSEASTGKWVYAVRLLLDQKGISLPERELKFVPGMTATIDVITGDRRLIGYFFEPLMKSLQDSFGER